MQLLPPEVPPDEPGAGWRGALLLLVLLGAVALVVGLVKVPAALWIAVPALVGAVVVLVLGTRAARRRSRRGLE